MEEIKAVFNSSNISDNDKALLDFVTKIQKK